MIKAVLCKSFGDPDQLVIDQIAELTPDDNEVIIQVVACSVNYPDTLMIKNMYQFKPEMPFSPGGEVSGIIKSVGSAVKHVKQGDKVFALCGWGGFAEEVKVIAKRVFPMPEGMDFITASSVMYNYGTSFHALKDRGYLKEGETLLVLGAAGGVGLAAVELGKIMGATVIAAASNDEKLLICKEKGADHIINYSEEGFRDKIKTITNGKGVDVIYDPVGDQYTEPALRSIAYNGRYLVVGFAAGKIPEIALNLALLKSCAITGVFWGQFAEKEPALNMKNLQQLANYFQKGQLKPHIYKTYPLEEAPVALWDMINRKVIGKAVVLVNEEANRSNPPIQKVEKSEVSEVQQKDGKFIFKNLHHLKQSYGLKLGTSDWVTMDQSKINDFARATEDFQWIHVDTERAKSESPFGKTIAHGFNVLAFSPKFLYAMFDIESAKLSLNYGCNKVRFMSPIIVDSKVRMHAILKETEIENGRGKVFIDVTFEAQGQDKPICVAELISMVIE
jgi:NADPH:quinone reductase-like Zn-dependent oxidoreductase/acyl dehydratase